MTAADSLKQALAGSFAIGAAVTDTKLSIPEQDLLIRNFSVITPENCLKIRQTQPQEGRFNFTEADALVDFALDKGIAVNGHHLICHSGCPDWVFLDQGKPARRELVLQRMRDHITKLVGHFSGRISSWEVVNEALDPGDGPYLRASPWYTALGDTYITEAYAAAHQADPTIKLYYNDYGLENPIKRQKAIRLIRELQQRRLPIAGIGIQGHWLLDRIPWKDLEASIMAFHDLGVEVMITELDIDVVPRRDSGADADTREHLGSDPYRGGLPANLQDRLANQYGQLFALFLKHRDKISRVSFWGLHDGRSWLNSWPRTRTNHPLLWDRYLEPKQAYRKVIDVVKSFVIQRP